MKTRSHSRLMLWICCLMIILPTGNLIANEEQLTVYNPLGQPPTIARVPMAPRLDTLNGKTIYLVDIGFTDTHQLLTEMQDLLGAKYPEASFVVRKKSGVYYEDDPELWAEIKAEGDGMIIGVGH